MTSEISWADPLLFAAALSEEEYCTFLYSGTDAGKTSILAWGLDKQIDRLDELQKTAPSDYIFGFLGYGFRTELENFKRDKNSYITLPDILFFKYKNILVFDHENKTVKGTHNKHPSLREGLGGGSLHSRRPPSFSPLMGEYINSNMTDAEYLKKAQMVIDKIRAGELYQANLTRKYFGEFSNNPNPFELYYELTQSSPAPMSAYMRFGNNAIISASPERFIKIENGTATTSPIKGTKSATLPASDLESSEKDRAENLMIADLMRNDLSKTCGNVRVTELFKVTTYKNYHHMHSTIVGDVKTNPLNVVLGAFPPGSMTGAPKIHAVKLCSELEDIERGVYSGILGYFRGNDFCDFSVVIRTLIVDGKKFEFQTGGGIVADSIPERELEETQVKAAALFKLLKN